jgi:hypothetical protein
MIISMSKPTKNIVLFIFALLTGLIAYYLCHITFVIYIVVKKREIPRFL